MQVVIDIQACQSACSEFSQSQPLLGWVAQLLRALQQHDVVLLANRGLEAESPDLQQILLSAVVETGRVQWRSFESLPHTAAYLTDRAWHRRASELLREHSLATLQADLVLVLNPWTGWDSDAVFSLAGVCNTPTWVVLPPLMTLKVLPVSGDGQGVAYALWQQRLWQEVRKADRLLVWEDPELWQQQCPELLGLSLMALGANLEAAARLVQQGLQSVGQGRDPEERAQDADPNPALYPVSGASIHLAGESPSDAASGSIPRRAASDAARPRLAYVSPLPPMASGIADYSADLIPALAQYYDLELVVSDVEAVALPWGDRYPIRSVAWFREHAASFERILYHFGNSPFHDHMVELLRHHPGTVVLHDFYLGHLFGNVHHRGKLPEALRRALFQSHGLAALQYWREHGEAAALNRYPCSFEVFAQADGVILHSAHALELARQWYGPELPGVVQGVPLAHASPALEELPSLRAQARKELGLAADDVLVCSFGYAGAGKRSLDLVRAWQQSALARQPGCRLVLVGGHQMDGPDRDALEAELRKPESVGVKLTGYVPAVVYRRYLAAADLAVQLRTSSRGETSRAVLDAFAYGVPLIVNAHGSAAELPPSTVVMLPDACSVDEIATALNRCLEDGELRTQLALAGGQYVREVHAPEQVASRYRDAIELAADQGSRAPGGRARAVVRLLAQEACLPGRYPLAADVAEVASRLARQAGRPGARPVMPDTTLICKPGQYRQEQPLRLWLVTEAAMPEVSGARKTALQQRRDAWCQAYEDGGLVVERVTWQDIEKLQDLSHADTSVSRSSLPDVIQVDHPDVCRQLGLAWQAEASQGQVEIFAAADSHLRPGLILDAWALAEPSVMSVDAARASVDPAVQTLAQHADLLWADSEAAAGAWMRLRGSAAGVQAVPAGGTLPTADRALSTAVYRDHLPQVPYALVLGDENSACVDDFLYFIGTSLAYLPPDAMLLLAGGLGRELEQDPRFARWRGINGSRCRIIAAPDELGMAALRRHAALVVLPIRSRLAEARRSALTADLLLDGHPVLASAAALQGCEAVAAIRQVMVENTPAGFRRRLAEWFQQQDPSKAKVGSLRQEEGAVNPLSQEEDERLDLLALRWEVVLARAVGEVQQLARSSRQRRGGVGL